MNRTQLKAVLKQDELPRNYYNILHDLSNPLPLPLDPRTPSPVSPEALLRLFVKECVRREVERARLGQP